MSHTKATLWSGAIALGALLTFGFAPDVVAKTRVKGSLTATSAAPRAHGRATLVLTTVSKGRFRVAAKGLAGRAAFDLVVDGVKVGSFTTNAAGRGKVRLSTHPKGSETLLGVDPRGKSIAVRDEHGEDDLEGHMPDGDDSPSGAFVCCLDGDDASSDDASSDEVSSHEASSDDGSGDDGSSDDESSDGDDAECELETPSECAEHGGTTLVGVDSCIPDPCGVTPPDDNVVCCFPGSVTGASIDGEFKPLCEDIGGQECALEGGVLVEADSCEDDPCRPSPPSGLVVCCVPEERQDGDDDAQGDESECEVLTVEHCSAVGGTASAVTSCHEDPCGEDDDSSDDHSSHD